MYDKDVLVYIGVNAATLSILSSTYHQVLLSAAHSCGMPNEYDDGVKSALKILSSAGLLTVMLKGGTKEEYSNSEYMKSFMSNALGYVVSYCIQDRLGDTWAARPLAIIAGVLTSSSLEGYLIPKMGSSSNTIYAIVGRLKVMYATSFTINFINDLEGMILNTGILGWEK